MSNGRWQRLTLLLALLYALVGCSANQANAVTEQTADTGKRSLELRIAYTADTKGNYEPCPT